MMRTRLAPSASAEGDFLGAARRPHEEQIGDVGAGDRQQQTDRRKQDHERGFDPAGQLLVHRGQRRGPVFFEDGIERLRTRGDGLQFRATLLDRDAGLEPGVHA